MEKEKLVNIFKLIGDMLIILGENPFKSRSYYNAARVIENLSDDIEKLSREGGLEKLKGIGEKLSQEITEFIRTGDILYYNDLREQVTDNVLELLRIQGLGPKKIHILINELNITSIHRLERACRDGKVEGIKGFGKRSQDHFLRGIEYLKTTIGSSLINHATIISEELIKHLNILESVDRIEIAGSLRRRNEIVNNINILVQSSDPGEVVKRFVEFPDASKVIEQGENDGIIKLTSGLIVNLNIIKEEEFPFALHHFTGSLDYNLTMQDYTNEINYQLNKNGLYKNNERIECSSEEEIFKELQLSFIPPELRENTGEIQSAKDGLIPDLVKEIDLKGVIHVHSTYSDGLNTIEELADYCFQKGYSYLVISDHSKAAFYAGGLKEADIIHQWDEIDQVNKKFKDKEFKIFKAIESDILMDGSLDYDDEMLSGFDLVFGSIHSGFKMQEDEMTIRIITAMKNPYLSILGHPSGRLLLTRKPYKVNLTEIIKTAAAENVMIEINSNPQRLDLDWRYCKQAKELGVKIIISTDAHKLEGIDFDKFGIGIARKGWLTKNDILNTLEQSEFEKFIKEHRKERLASR